MGGSKSTMTLDLMDAVHEGGQTTEVADWVIDLDLSPQAFRLYVRMCRIAKDDDPRGVRITLSRQEAAEYAKGDGEAAMQELLKVRAVKKLAQYPSSGESRFEIEIYSPEVNALLGRHVQVEGAPVVTYG